MAAPRSQPGWGTGHLPGLPVTVWYAAIIAFAVVALALLRHLFADIRVGTH